MSVRSVLVVAKTDHNVNTTATYLTTRQNCTIYIGCLHGRRTTGDVIESVRRHKNGTVTITTSITSRGSMVRLFRAMSRRLKEIATLMGGTNVLRRRVQMRSVGITQLRQIFSAGVVNDFLYTQRTIGQVSAEQNNAKKTVIGISSTTTQLNSTNRCISCTTSGKTVSAVAVKLTGRITSRNVHMGTMHPNFVCASVRTDKNRPGQVRQIGRDVPVGQNKRTARITGTVL